MIASALSKPSLFAGRQASLPKLPNRNHDPQDEQDDRTERHDRWSANRYNPHRPGGERSVKGQSLGGFRQYHEILARMTNSPQLAVCLICVIDAPARKGRSLMERVWQWAKRNFLSLVSWAYAISVLIVAAALLL
jgi:hypothetical protein